MRLFAGLGFAGDVKDSLAEASRALEPWIPGARWVPRDNYHVTFAFLGSVAGERVDAIAGALAAVASGLPAGEVSLSGLGAFPSSRRARVIWAGLTDPDGLVARAAEAVLAAMEDLGFPRDQRAFHAHVTLARLKVPAPVILGATAAPQGRVAVNALTLFQSRLGRPAPTYQALSTFPLIGD